MMSLFCTVCSHCLLGMRAGSKAMEWVSGMETIHAGTMNTNKQEIASFVVCCFLIIVNVG